MIKRTLEELEKDIRDKLIIDTRGRDDFEKGAYPNAINSKKF